MQYIGFAFAILLLWTVLGHVWRRSRWIWIAGACALFLYCWPPFAWLAARTLEAGYSIGPVPAGDAEAIVVLASNVSAPRAGIAVPLPDTKTYLRCRYGAWLFHNWKQVPILTSGGPASPNGTPMALSMRDILVEAGVPPLMLWTEERSRSTYENAVFSAQVLRSHGIRRITLVTSAHHMLRAERCFAKQGLAVVPAACGHTTFENVDVKAFLPSWKSVQVNDDITHEWAGLLWYFLRNRF